MTLEAGLINDDAVALQFILFGKPSIKKCMKIEIVLKGGRGSIWKPNFSIVRNKEIFSQEGGVQSQKVLNFVPIYSGLIISF